MEKSAQLVPFQGDSIEAVREGGDVWVSVRRVCEALGISNQGQQAKLGGREWATIKTVLTVGADGRDRQMFAIHLDALPMWLATIEPSRVKPEVRGKLARYQIEAARVLRDHFFPRATSHPAAAMPALAGTLRTSTGMLTDVRRLVGAAAKASGAREQRVRGWMVREFRAASYLDIALPLAAYARERLIRVLCGEEVPPWNERRRALPAPTAQLVFPPPIASNN